MKIRYGERLSFFNINEKGRQSYITVILLVEKSEYIRCKPEGNICLRKVELNMVCVCVSVVLVTK